MHRELWRTNTNAYANSNAWITNAYADSYAV
jgi:hypothetical protein